jgi:hypothetical protein
LKTKFKIKSSCLAIAVVFVGLYQTTADDELKKKATWKQPTTAEIRVSITRWLDQKQADELTRAKIEAVLADENFELTGDALEIVGEVLAIAEPRVSDLVQSVGKQREGRQNLSLKILDVEDLDPIVRNNVSLLAARWLAQNDLYDESRSLLELLKTDDVLDPASLLFFRALVTHRLFDKTDCTKNIDRLFENKDALPRRFAQVATLMQADIKAMKDESLDHAARMMDDINRRISLYRSGKRVIGEEKKVIDMLDKIVEELEKKQQQQQGGSTNPSSPMQDSRIAGGKGDGKAAPKNYGEGGEWGDLPPAKRAEAMAEMAKGLPPHYREVIEEYFRKLAEENDK